MPPGTASPDDKAFVNELYARFNARDVEHLIGLMKPDVAWPNGMDGGYEIGRDAVRAYWTRQWTLIDPKVTPLRVDAEPDGRLAVQVRQVVSDLAGQVLRDSVVTHLYALDEGRISTMEIVAPATDPA